MATRKILFNNDPTLSKKSRPVTSFDKRLHRLLDDMGETLTESGGVGLAAPQVGILRRVALVLETNVEDPDHEYIIELINPEIIEVSGEQNGAEGCLSFPGVYGMVRRPESVRVKAQNREGNFFEVEGQKMTARAFCHEIDHLDGVLFVSKADRILADNEMPPGEDEPDETDNNEEK